MPFSSPDGRYHPYVFRVPSMQRRKRTAWNLFVIFGEILGGLHDKHEGGLASLKAPIAPSVALFVLVIVPFLILLALLRT